MTSKWKQTRHEILFAMLLMFRHIIWLPCIFILIAFSPGCHAELQSGGHAKFFYAYSSFPEDSVLADEANPYRESLGNLRLKAAYHGSNWETEVHYLLNGLYSKELSGCLIRGGITGGSCQQLASDREQLFDLSSVVSDADTSLLFQRLDRLSMGYSSEHFVARFGRQAISWGNGMVYNPLDLFNPFAPDAIDTEYKSGDDMLYLQRLFTSGNDLQVLLIPRRNRASGDLDSRASAVATKYHRFGTSHELDIMAASNYADEIIGAAFTRELYENVVNLSLTLTHTDTGDYLSAAANYNFSSVIHAKNLSAFVELFYNGFGIAGDEISLQDVIRKTDLLDRLARSELYTIGRYYLAGGATLELTPLFNLSPTLFVNLGDQSAMLQLSVTYSLLQNLDLLAGFNLPAGRNGTEFGGIYLDSPDQESILSPGKTLFTRIAWYF